MCSTDSQQLQMSRYETAHGIYDHVNSDDKVNPLAIVRMHAAEDPYKACRLYERDRQFIAYRVNHYTGLSMSEFFDMPRHRVENIFRECARLEKEKSKLGTAGALGALLDGN